MCPEGKPWKFPVPWNQLNERDAGWASQILVSILPKIHLSRSFRMKATGRDVPRILKKFVAPFLTPFPERRK
jgi:hypothetical protein